MNSLTRPVRLKRRDWSPRVKKALNDWLADCCARRSDPIRPYAVFDFDNTCSVFDDEETVGFYQIERMAFSLSPEALERCLLTDLSDPDATHDNLGPSFRYRDLAADIRSAYESLVDAHGVFPPEGLGLTESLALQTEPAWQEFAAKMGALFHLVYAVEPPTVAVVWFLYRFSGKTDDELYALATDANRYYSTVPSAYVIWSSPAGYPSAAGHAVFTRTRGISCSENVGELWRALKQAGVDIWVASASTTPVIRAAIDFYGLHDAMTGLLAQEQKHDENGRLLPAHNPQGHGVLALTDGGWKALDEPIAVRTVGENKVIVLEHSAMPRYGGRGPEAAFIDSNGDYNFCTAFASLRLGVVINRADRSARDGGALLAALALLQHKRGLNYRRAKRDGETLFLLQGRNDNTRTFRRSAKTVRLGTMRARLFDGPENVALYRLMRREHRPTAELLDNLSLRHAAGEALFPDSDASLPFATGFRDTCRGYHAVR